MSLIENFDKAWSEVTARASCVVHEKEELFALCSLFQAHGVEGYLELGASEGVSMYVIGKCLPKGSEIVAVDLGEPHSKGHLLRNKEFLIQEWYRCHVELKTTEDFSKCLVAPDPWMTHAIMIDAGHTYEDVKKDWEMFAHRAEKMVVLHDIRHPGVREFWNEIKTQHRTLEIHAGRYTVFGGEKMGFGIVFTA